MVQLIIMVMDLLKPFKEKGLGGGVAQGEGDEGVAKQQQEAEEEARKIKVVRSLIGPCLSGIEAALREKR